jgi:glycosyltransferase involved in cell wall biosynthesis
MKVFLIIPTLGKGGAERVVSNLSKGFTELGHDVYVIIFSGPVAYETHGSLINYGINYSSPNKFKILFSLLRCVYRLKKDIKQIKPDCVFSFMEFANFCAILASKKSNVSVRASLNQLNARFKLVSRFLYPKANKVIAVSNQLAYDLKSQYKIRNVCMIQNALNFKEISFESKAGIDINEGFILGVGRLSKEKNFILLVNAYFQLFRDKRVNLPQLVILGDGILKEKMQEYICGLGLERKILLMGSVDNPYKFMARCRIFVLPSLNEGFPNALIEAMACGALCIATDCPTGPNEIIKHGVNGFLVKNNDVELMKEAIEQCLSDNFDAEKMKAMARKSVEHLSLQNICNKYLALCNN